VNFGLEVFDWSETLVGAAFGFIGVTVALVGPFLLSRYYETGLTSYAAGISVLGSLAYAIAGTGLSNVTTQTLAYIGLLLLGIGGVWNNCMQVSFDQFSF
jgi:hypothetical protein